MRLVGVSTLEHCVGGVRVFPSSDRDSSSSSEAVQPLLTASPEVLQEHIREPTSQTIIFYPLAIFLCTDWAARNRQSVKPKLPEQVPDCFGPDSTAFGQRQREASRLFSCLNDRLPSLQADATALVGLI